MVDLKDPSNGGWMFLKHPHPHSTMSKLNSPDTETVKETTILATESTLKSDIISTIRERANTHPLGSLRSGFRICEFNEDSEGIFTDFTGKSIVDIGSGFSGTPWVLKNARHIILVDPIFWEQDRREQVRKNIDALELSLVYSKKTLSQANATNIWKIREEIVEKQAMMDEVKPWEKFFDNFPENVTLDASVGENIDMIPSESTDVVLCNYVLSKETVNPLLVRDQIFRILSPKSIIIIADTNNKTGSELWLLFARSKFSMRVYFDEKRVFFVIRT